MTIVPESGRQESVPGCRGWLPALGAGHSGALSPRAAADGTAVARAGQGGRIGRSSGKSRPAEGGGEKEQPGTGRRLNWKAERL